MINAINISFSFSTNITGENKTFEIQKQIPVRNCIKTVINTTISEEILSNVVKKKDTISKFEDAMRIIGVV